MATQSLVAQAPYLPGFHGFPCVFPCFQYTTCRQRWHTLQDQPPSTHRAALRWQSTPAYLIHHRRNQRRQALCSGFWGIFFTGQLGSTADCMGKRAPVWAMEPKPVGALWLGWTNCSTLSQSPRTTLRPKLKSAVIFFCFKSNWENPLRFKGFCTKKLQYSKSCPTKVCLAKISCKTAARRPCFITSNGLILLPTTRGSYLRQDLPKTWICSALREVSAQASAVCDTIGP